MKNNIPFELKKSQKEAINKIHNKKYSILTNDCGTGKTVVGAYSAVLSEYIITIVCKAANRAKWKETMAWFPDAKVRIITSFAQVHKVETKGFSGTLLIDEAHKMGGYTTRRGRKIINLAKKADKMILLTATPSFKNPIDFYWYLKMCKVYRGTSDDFKIRYCSGFRLPMKTFIVLGKPSNIDELKTMFKKLEVNTAKTRKLTLNIKRIFTKSHGLQNPLFEEVAEFRRLIAEKKLESFYRFIRLGKLPKRCIIFTHHKKVTKKCTELLKCDMLIGGMTEKQRTKAVSDFESGKNNYLVISINAGGEGLDIENCDTCFFLELSFSPMKDRQAFLRMARSEKDKVLNVNFFISKDEHTWRVNQGKTNYLEEIYG